MTRRDHLAPFILLLSRAAGDRPPARPNRTSCEDAVCTPHELSFNESSMTVGTHFVQWTKVVPPVVMSKLTETGLETFFADHAGGAAAVELWKEVDEESDTQTPDTYYLYQDFIGGDFGSRAYGIREELASDSPPIALTTSLTHMSLLVVHIPERETSFDYSRMIHVELACFPEQGDDLTNYWEENILSVATKHDEDGTIQAIASNLCVSVLASPKRGLIHLFIHGTHADTHAEGVASLATRANNALTTKMATSSYTSPRVDKVLQVLLKAHRIPQGLHDLTLVWKLE